MTFAVYFYYVKCYKDKMFHSQWFKSTSQCRCWGHGLSCFRSCGAGPLRRLDEKFNSDKYLDMLSNIVEPFAQENMPPNWIYQQDNSLC